MSMRILMLFSLLLLSGCAGATFSKEARIALPDIIEYSHERQIKAADELGQFEVPTLMEFLKDYYVMRQQARRARGG